MKTFGIVCLMGSLFAATLSLLFLSSSQMDREYALAHRELERIAFSKDGSAELKKAVTDQRIADKSRFVRRDMARRLIWISLAFSGVALLATLIRRRKEPNPTLETMR